jgi:peptidoglycan/LPS O-acetylase OafA/YrhL
MQPSLSPGHPAAGHRPEIDGLRALAIAPVVLHHAAPDVLPGGFAGVDVFFVISGYLITAIILREMAEGRFTLLGFWERRARRIIPALAAMLAATTLAAWAILTPDDFAEYAKALLAASVFASNIRFAQGTGYFDWVEGNLPLLHTWTLGVEEQFYLVFPLMVLAAWRLSRGAVLPLIAVTGLASLALALWYAPRYPLLTFYLLPTRMWELMLGAACAALPRPPRADGRLAAAGIVLILAGFALIDPSAPSPGPGFLLPTIGTALVLLFADPANRAGQVLAWRPFVGLGLVSFGPYLWHQPVLALARYVHFGPLPPLALTAAVLAAVGLATISWRWIEEPVRRRRVLARPALLFAACAAALAVPFAVGAAGSLRALLPLSGAEAQRLAGLQPAGVHDTVAIPHEGSIDFVLYGDSHAGQYLAAARARFGAEALLSQNGCLAADGLSNGAPRTAKTRACAALPDRLVALVTARRIPTVLWAQRWDRPLFDSATGQPIGRSSAEAGPALLAALERTVARLPRGTRVIVLGNSPTAWAAGDHMAGGWMRCEAYRNMVCRPDYPAHLAEGRIVNAKLKAFAARHPQVTFIDVTPALCADGRCRIVENGRLNYWDGSHMTPAAAARVMALVDPALVGKAGAVLP